MYEQFIQSLNEEDVINLAKLYFGITFTKNEIQDVLPYLKAHYQDYFNPSTREALIENVRSLTKEETFDKLIFILNSAEAKYRK